MAKKKITPVESEIDEIPEGKVDDEGDGVSESNVALISESLQS